MDSPVISQSIQTIRSLVARLGGLTGFSGLSGLLTGVTLSRRSTLLVRNPQGAQAPRLQ
jgi:hypothetical protein